MRKPSIIAIFVLCCSIVLFSSQSYAAPSKDDVDIENIKAPPRDVRDVLRILNETKPDFALLEKAKKIVNLPVPDTSDKASLGAFYFRRGLAQEVLGYGAKAVEDVKKAVNEYPSPLGSELRLDELATYASLLSQLGNQVEAIKILEEAKNQANKGYLISLNRNIALNCLTIGDLDCANLALKQIEQNLSAINFNQTKYQIALSFRTTSELIPGEIYLTEGKYAEAERSFFKAYKYNTDILDSIKDAGRDALDSENRFVQDATSSLRLINILRIRIQSALSKAFLGQKRFIDSEFWAREAVLLSINRFGSNSTRTSAALLTLTMVISEQGRAGEAVLLAQAALRVAQQASLNNASPAIALARKTLASCLVAEGKYAQAERVFAEMVEGIKGDPEVAAKYPAQDLDWALALVKTGKSAQAATMTGEMIAKDSARLDKNSPRLAMERAFNAAALQAAGHGSSASSEFKVAIPVLVNQAQNDVENATESVRQAQRLTFVFEGYLANLAQQAKADTGGPAAAEAFQIADITRGSGVQRALTSSAARSNIKDPQLANLARKEQDLQQRINTLTTLLTGLLSAPADQQLPTVQAKIRTDIASFKSERDSLKKEIERKFPDYAQLVDPKPASIVSIQKILKPDEVLVTWYFADNASYVWAITKDKPAQFSQLTVGRSQIAKEVAQLRKALDPGVATIDEIPAFDVVLANQLYQQVLAPVQSAFAGKKVMLTVPHAELGQLPLSLLVTKPTPQPAKGGAIPFSGYKTIPWLTRDIAVAQLPSVISLTALRSLPAGNANRKNFIGFGDPYFSSEQEKSAQKQVKTTQLATRGIPLSLRSAPKTSGVSSAELALLPRLPDTSLELEEIGKAIGAGDGDIFLHKQASVKQVMSTDLSNRKVVMFATHGLVPGELNGLTQPALALSSPDVTGDKDDGLLTMDKVLTLKLDADWVVLSACNTAAGEGAGSEAVSGLGRAFFFAGAKALLVSNWPVDSVASRTMMTDLFKNQQKAQGTSKAELLRQAMLNQVDQGGMKEGSTMKYSYAHPLFWAPFVVVGD